MSHFPKDFFIEFGCHKASGGFAFKSTNKVHFENELIKAFDKYQSTKQIETQVVDKKYMINYADINNHFLESLFKMKPFGLGNQNPVFIINNISISSVKYFGKESEHLEIIINSYKNHDNHVIKITPAFLNETYRYGGSPSKNLKTKFIQFFYNENFKNKISNLTKEKFYSIEGNIEESNFLGKYEIRVKVLDIYES